MWMLLALLEALHLSKTSLSLSLLSPSPLSLHHQTSWWTHRTRELFRDVCVDRSSWEHGNADGHWAGYPNLSQGRDITVRTVCRQTKESGHVTTCSYIKKFNRCTQAYMCSCKEDSMFYSRNQITTSSYKLHIQCWRNTLPLYVRVCVHVHTAQSFFHKQWEVHRSYIPNHLTDLRLFPPATPPQ